MRRALVIVALLSLAGCGGGGGERSRGRGPAASRRSPADRTLAPPSGWQVADVQGGRAQGHGRAGAAGGRRGRGQAAAVSRSCSTPSTRGRVHEGQRLQPHQSDQTLRRGNWKITRDAEYDLAGAETARVIEADHVEKTGTATTPVRTTDVLVRTEKGSQLDSWTS